MNEKRVPPIQRGFWSRQFAGRATRGQMLFDGVFGLLLPALCIFLAPEMLSDVIGFTPLADAALLDRAIPVAVYLEMGLLLLWFFTRRRLGMWNGLLAGALMLGALCAGAIGMVLLPLGLMAVDLGAPIGWFGLVPPLTAAVFFRNSIRAARSDPSASVGRTLGMGLVGMLLVATVIVGSAVYIEHRLDNIYTHVIGSGRQPTVAMEWFIRRWDADAWEVRSAYVDAFNARDSEEAQRLAAIYLGITGKDIEMETGIVMD